MSNFKKIYFKGLLKSELDERKEEKKNLESLLPTGYNKPDFDYSQPWIKNKGGYVIVTGKLNNITVLDFDDMDLYNEACLLVTDLHTYYTVKTRRGMHVYFEYNADITIEKKFEKIDVQTKGKLIIGQDTMLHRYNNEKTIYTYVGGKIKPMPKALMNWCCNLKKSHKQHKDYETNIDYNYEVTDSECREILDKMVEQQNEYFTEYSKWITFTAIMKTLNKMEIWDEYSEKYDSDNYCKYKNMSIWRGINTKISINFFCKLLNIPAMKYHKHVPEDELFNDISYYEEDCRFVNQKYINISYEDFKNHDTVIGESGTGTGKTTNVSRLFNKYKKETGCTILSIVNLISLANQQRITFAKATNKEINLHMYNEDKINASIIIANDSVICINSLWRLHDCNFKNKVVYIDEVYSLCMTLTHNDKLTKQRQVFNTLYRMINECKKLIVSDAHIHNNVMKILESRLFNSDKSYVHYINKYQKFNGIPAVKYNDENEFFNEIQKKVLNGNSFSFGSDCKKLIEKWYYKLYNSASIETQKKMLLYTSASETKILEDWNNKIIFYSPTITTGVDITCINSSQQYMYITGQSVSSINLLQMATRTRNMNQLSYFSSVRSNASLYDSFEDCKTKVCQNYVVNQLAYSVEDIEDYVAKNEIEDMNLNLYIRNAYALDLHQTNILYFFEQELRLCGFTMLNSIGTYCKMDKGIKNEMNNQSQIIMDEKYELLLESFNSEIENIPNSIKPMAKRCELLNLNNAELIEEYRDVVEDEHKLEHFWNYNRLNKSLQQCENKIVNIINTKMVAGNESNCWFKIQYVHKLAEICNIKDDLFAIDKIEMPELNKKNIKITTCIKTLYNKRDVIKPSEYDLDCIRKLYKFMMDSLIKKLGLISSSRSKKKGEDRDKQLYEINTDVKMRFDKLIEIMNPKIIIEFEVEMSEN